eukprot:4280288-Ditylum_brightwellii.AAC.2
MQLPIDIVPEEVKKEYKLHEKVKNGYVYIELRNRMYGLPQASILTNKLLIRQLATKGYKLCCHTPCHWKHEWGPVQFSLVVDDFGIKYADKEHVHYLLPMLHHWYEVAEDWSGERCCVLTIEQNYEKGHVDFSMP